MIKQLSSCVALAAIAVLVAGCASPSRSIDKAAESRAATASAAAPTPSDFPDLASAVWKQGAFPSADALRSMRAGMGKDQVRESLGWPHFREGLWGVKEWNYIFHFRTAQAPSANYETCQYMVRFNADALVSGTYWNRPDCERFTQVAARPAATEPVQPPAAPVAAPERISLGADALFRFDGSSEQDLLPEGRRKVDELAARLRDFRQIDGIAIVGHTDRLGSQAYNKELSTRRARTVGALLSQRGVPTEKISTSGAGEADPLVTCAQANRQALIACLAPNRRVDLTVRGLAK